MTGKYAANRAIITTQKITATADSSLAAGAEKTYSLSVEFTAGYTPIGFRTLRCSNSSHKLVIGGWRFYSTSIQVTVYNADSAAITPEFDLVVVLVDTFRLFNNQS